MSLAVVELKLERGRSFYNELFIIDSLGDPISQILTFLGQLNK